jgi:hypothetical protein
VGWDGEPGTGSSASGRGGGDRVSLSGLELRQGALELGALVRLESVRDLQDGVESDLRAGLELLLQAAHESVFLHAVHVAHEDAALVAELALKPRARLLVDLPEEGFVHALVLDEPAVEHRVDLAHPQARLDGLDLLTHPVLEEAPAQPPIEEASGFLPGHDILDAVLLEHALRRVVEVRDEEGHLPVDGLQPLLPGAHLRLDDRPLLRSGLHVPLAKPQHLPVLPLHDLHHVLEPELDLDDALGLEDAAPARVVREHLHAVGVDARVDDRPGAAPQLPVGWHVHDDRPLVLAQLVHNVRPELDDLLVHVWTGVRDKGSLKYLDGSLGLCGDDVERSSRTFHAAGEAAPVGEDDEGQLFAAKVLDRLGRLVGAVRIPDLTGLRDGLGFGVGVRRVRGQMQLDRPRLHGDDAAGDAAEAAPPRHHCLRPRSHDLLRGERSGTNWLKSRWGRQYYRCT